MSDRPVTRTGKNHSGGDITEIGNFTDAWSPRAKADAVRDIETGAHTYYVPWRDGRTEIRVIDGPNGKYLRTDRDNTSRNNLLDLQGL
ncbi:DUF3892 domain-containing protein [Gryllotalpicola reticulitermitis]|uniref:DUF3892 domain-containing protein n=1 Tax=Gryllotalpicola reticulitermitis TaxID=1184153 RepID=A0ABV8Q4N9_9MICO